MTVAGGQTALAIVEQDQRVGTKVQIVNMRSITGTLFVEGRAKVVEVLRDYGPETGFDAIVRFPGDEESTVQRFIDATAQEDPQMYCDGLNEARAQMRAAAAGRGHG